MLMGVNLEITCAAIAEMSKKDIINRLLHFEYPVPLDFTEEYLAGLDLDKLRHILLAAFITAQQKHTPKPRND